MVEHMNALGWDVYSFDHEGGDGQYEFDFGYTDALDDGRPDADLPADGQARRRARSAASPRSCRSRSSTRSARART